MAVMGTHILSHTYVFAAYTHVLRELKMSPSLIYGHKFKLTIFFSADQIVKKKLWASRLALDIHIKVTRKNQRFSF